MVSIQYPIEGVGPCPNVTVGQDGILRAGWQPAPWVILPPILHHLKNLAL
jgi:hypothetical protein